MSHEFDGAARPEARASDPAAGAALLHELEVQRMELAMQNAQLRDTQHELEESRQRYLTLFQHVPTASLSLGSSGVVIESNFAAQRLFGLSRVRMKGRPMLLLVHPSEHPRFLRHLEIVREFGAASPLEFRFNGRDGSSFPGIFEIQRVPDSHRRSDLLCTVTDVSERERQEEILRRANEEISRARHQAELALAAKSRFLAAASHDLRQPVQALHLFAEVLAKQLDGHAARTTLGRLSDSLGALSELLDSILDISKLEAGLIVPEVVEVDARKLLNRVGSEFSLVAAARGLDMRLVVRPAILRCDPILLERMLRNLLQNAVRYTQSGGLILSGRARRGCYAIEVWDTGIGIPEDQTRLIFEDFHQVGNHARNRAEGLGLGLAIVERLARLLECRVEVKSRLGHGSRFAIDVPILRNAA